MQGLCIHALKQVVCILGERCRKREEAEESLPLISDGFVFMVSLRQQVGGKSI